MTTPPRHLGSSRDPSLASAEPTIDARLGTHNDILDLIVQNAPLPTVLRVVIGLLERELPGARASILLMDDDDVHMRVGAGPSLPPEFHAAIDGLAIGSTTGSCGTAAKEKRVVVTPNIAADPAWETWQDAAAAAGLAACWSTPFSGQHDRVLGTFAVYFDEPREPEPRELALLRDAGYLTAAAVHHDAIRRELRDTNRTHPLTRIANRIAMDERLRIIEAVAAETGSRFAVLQIAIEGLSPINESLGPSVGDAVLKAAARRIADLVDGAGLAAHLWGSEFVVLVDNLVTDGDAHLLAEKAREMVTRPIEVDGMTLVVGVSVGVSVHGAEIVAEGRPVDEPLRTAHVARDRAKAAGDEQIGIYDPTGDPGVDVHLLAPALRRSIDANELALAYQPIVRLADEKLDHVEALLRWTTPSGTVAPDAFVPVAERTGLVRDLGRYALALALSELARRRAAAGTVFDTGVSVNLSARQLSDDALPDLVAELLAENGVPAQLLTLEVTEGVLLGASDRGWRTLERIRDSGVRISLDDFGTGFSHVSYLRRFRFDEIKIDRTFVRDMDTDRTARAIVVGMVALGRAAELAVVAEGIERPAQAQRLRDLGASHGQGYLFGRPRQAGRPTPGGRRRGSPGSGSSA